MGAVVICNRSVIVFVKASSNRVLPGLPPMDCIFHVTP